MADDAPRPDERLESWKDIAAYLRRDVRTVQRWEQTDGLPVHRLKRAQRPIPYAYKAELDAWWNSRSDLRAAASATTTPQPQPEPRQHDAAQQNASHLDATRPDGLSSSPGVSAAQRKAPSPDGLPSRFAPSALAQPAPAPSARGRLILIAAA